MPRAIQPLPFDLLETFVTLMQHDGDTTRTAHTLDINQPSLSKRLAFLQHHGKVLHRPWLKRSGKTWSLTHEGTRVLPAVREILDRYQVLADFTNAPRANQSVGAIRFACGHTSGAFIVRKALSEFRRLQPHHPVRVSTMRAPESILGVAAGSIDMALTGRDNAEIRQHAREIPVHIEEIGRFGYCLACSKASRWAAEFKKLPERPLPLSVLADFPLIVPDVESHTRRTLDPIVHRQTWAGKVEFRVEISGWLTILDYVRAGHGIGLVSELAVTRNGDNNLLIRHLAGSRLAPLAMKLVIRRFETDLQDEQRDALLKSWQECLVNAIAA